MDIHGTLGLQQEGIPIGRPHASTIFSLMQHPRRIGNPRAKLLEGPTLPSSNTFRMSSSKTAFTKVCQKWLWINSHEFVCRHFSFVLVAVFDFYLYCLKTSAVQWHYLAIYSCFSVPLIPSTAKPSLDTEIVTIPSQRTKLSEWSFWSRKNSSARSPSSKAYPGDGSDSSRTAEALADAPGRFQYGNTSIECQKYMVSSCKLYQVEMVFTCFYCALPNWDGLWHNISRTLESHLGRFELGFPDCLIAFNANSEDLAWEYLYDTKKWKRSVSPKMTSTHLNKLPDIIGQNSSHHVERTWTAPGKSRKSLLQPVKMMSIP